MMWMVTTAWALPPCDENAGAELERVQRALEKVEPTLSGLTRQLPSLDELAYGFARPDGTWIVRGSTFEPTCELDGEPLYVAMRWPMGGSGSMSLFADQGPLLVMGDPMNWKPAEWEAIAAHEWVHVQQAHLLGFDQYPSVERWPLTKRYLRKASFRSEVDNASKELATSLTESVSGTCSPRVWTAFESYQAAVPKRLRSTSENYVKVEGFARYFEKRFEALAAQTSFDPKNDCLGVENAEYGYEMGCLLAAHQAVCLGKEWNEQSLTTPLSELQHKSR